MNSLKVLDKCQIKHNCWLLRDMSLLGRVFLTKMEGISRTIKKKSTRFTLVSYGKKKTHYMKRVEMTIDFKDGGLLASDFDSINGTLKIKWWKTFVNNKNVWFHIPREFFKKLGGIDVISLFNVSQLNYPSFTSRLCCAGRFYIIITSHHTIHHYGIIYILQLGINHCMKRTGWRKVFGQCPI